MAAEEANWAVEGAEANLAAEDAVLNEAADGVRGGPRSGAQRLNAAGSDERRARRLAWLLRLLGLIDLLALAAVAMPASWVASAHQRLGLGVVPEASIVIYLARSASAMYALHGATLIFLSLDVRRYAGLIRFLAVLAVLHGMAIIVIDAAAGMPLYWTVAEGPCYAATGIAVLLVQGRALPKWRAAP